MSNGGVGPNIGDFTLFVTNNMNVPAYVLASPSTTNAIQYAFNYAQQFVNPNLCGIPGIQGAWSLFTLAVYNLAADTLINIAQDAQPYVAFNPPGPATNPPNALPYWQWVRQQFGVLSFVAGVVQSTGDEGTNTSIQVAKQFENYTISNLQNLKTPYGRAYLGIAGSYGSLWGLT